MTALVPLLAAVALVIAVVAVTLLSRRGRSGGSPFRLRAATVVAWVFFAIALVTTALRVGGIWLSPEAMFPVQVHPFQPALPPDVEIAGIHPDAVTGGGLTSGEVLIQGADSATRAWATLSALAGGALFAAVAFVVARIANAAKASEGLTSRLIGGLSIVVLALGTLQQWFEQSTAASAAQFVYGSVFLESIPSAEDPSVEVPFLWPRTSFGIAIDFWPIGAALALAALAAVIRHGERLQRDTEALV